MNTVLDDNKKLCLMSGEIIQLAPTTNLLFEPMDLEQASPATVSRCGMIYMEPSSLGWRPIVKSWLSTLPATLDENKKKIINDMFERFIDPCLQMIRKGGLKELVTTSDSNLVKSCMNLLDCQFDKFLDAKKMNTFPPAEVVNWLEGMFIFALIWSLGASLNSDSRNKFDYFLRKIMDGEINEEDKKRLNLLDTVPMPAKKYEIQLPEASNVFSFKFITQKEEPTEEEKEAAAKDPNIVKLDETQANKYWEPWSLALNNTPPIPKDALFNEIIVETVDTIRYTHLMQILVTHQKPILFVGPTGTGKSAYVVEYLLNKTDKQIYKPILINFSAQTSSNQTQDIIMSKLDKRRKGVFGPPVGQKCIVFVDDVNMPQVEVYGAQAPIELLRQWFDHGNWYDRKDQSKITLIDVQLLCAMGPPGGGRNNVTARFLRHFNLIAINEFDDIAMTTIFSKILNWHVFVKNFPDPFKYLVPKIISATLSIYKEAMKNLLPTPTKSHYVFNLRDFARVIQGLTLSEPEGCTDINAFQRLWIHEIFRVYYDRLVDDSDRKWLYEYTIKVTSDELKENFHSILSFLDQNRTGKVTEDNLRSLMFCDFGDPKNEAKRYLEVNDLNAVRQVVEQSLEEYNQVNKRPMHLVMFRFAIEHVSRISRVLKQPRSHALLVGVGGSGRQSLTRLATHMCEYELFQVEISKTYSMNEWHEDIKRILRKSTESEQHGVFLFTDTQIKEEAFLEDVNNLLNAGEVPNLFPADEKQEICDKMRALDRQRDKSKQTDGSPVALFNMFIQRCRDQLHIVLAMSPIGESFRNRLRKFPSLVNCCTIDWFQPWPEDALEAVAQRSFEEIDLSAEDLKGCIETCKYFHVSTQRLSAKFLSQLDRHNYVTPTSYLELISTFKTLLFKQRQ
jgi:dynein heavy chain